MKRKMFYGASHLLFDKARELRNNMTDAETILWGYLRQHPMGMKFRRQHPLGIYIADFYCHKLKLVIEVDGKIHDKDAVKIEDEKRQNQLELDGLRIVRFKNEEILKKPEIVFESIDLLITELSKVKYA
jgi:imidazole glycerol-phosphate synthase subunit HisF